MGLIFSNHTAYPQTYSCDWNDNELSVLCTLCNSNPGSGFYYSSTRTAALVLRSDLLANRSSMTSTNHMISMWKAPKSISSQIYQWRATPPALGFFSCLHQSHPPASTWVYQDKMLTVFFDVPAYDAGQSFTPHPCSGFVVYSKVTNLQPAGWRPIFINSFTEP